MELESLRRLATVYGQEIVRGADAVTAWPITCRVYNKLDEGLPASYGVASDPRLHQAAAGVVWVLWVTLVSLPLGAALLGLRSLYSGGGGFGGRDWRRCLRRLRRPQAARPSEFELRKERRVQQVADEHYQQIWRKYLPLSVFILWSAMLLLSVQGFLLRLGPKARGQDLGRMSGYSDRQVSYVLIESNLPMVWILLVWCIWMARRRERIDNLGINASTVLIVVSMQLQLLGAKDNPILFLQYQIGGTLFRVLLMNGCGNTALLGLLNAACAVTSLMLKGHFFAEAVLVVQGQPGPTCLGMHVALELLVAAVLTCVAVQSRQTLLEQIRRTHEAQNSSRFERAAESLMAGMCDAVAFLGPTLALLRPAQLLGSLLLKDGPCPLGQSFYDLLKEPGDRATLQQFIQRNIEQEEAGGPVGTLQMSLKDSWNMPMNVQIFHTRFCDASGELCHIIGIRDLSGEESFQREFREERTYRGGREESAERSQPSRGGREEEPANFLSEEESKSASARATDGSASHARKDDARGESFRRGESQVDGWADWVQTARGPPSGMPERGVLDRRPRSPEGGRSSAGRAVRWDPRGDSISEGSTVSSGRSIPLPIVDWSRTYPSSPREGEERAADQDLASVWVANLEIGWPMLRCTPEFKRIAGPSLYLHEPALSWAGASSQFSTVVQMVAAEMMESGITSSTVPQRLEIHPRHLRQHYLEADVQLRVVSFRRGGAASAAVPCVEEIQIVLGNVAMKKVGGDSLMARRSLKAIRKKAKAKSARLHMEGASTHPTGARASSNARVRMAI